MTDHNSLARACAVAASASTPTGKAIRCERSLHISFFFDGFARNLESDLINNQVSNIGRLFLAHKDLEDNTDFVVFRAAYLSGLGASYDASLGTQASGGMNRAQSTAMEVPSDVAGDQAFEVAKDTLSGRNWWQRLKRDLGSLRENPLKGVKVLKDTFINTAAELIEPIRDSPIAAHLLKSGADVRLEGALSELNTTITKLQGGIPLRSIKISVFGFDFGATLARAFVHEMMSRSQQREAGRYYRNAQLEIVFAGLFDAVDRSAAEMPPIEYVLPATNALDDGGLIHPDVKAVLHLVAAHERRFYRRARLLGDSRRNWREELMPGISEDIGGGLAPGEQKPSNELALVSLHQMYRAAFSAGVALAPLESLPKKGRMIAALFEFNDRTPGQHSAFGLVRRYQSLAGRQAPGHDAFISHMRLYIRWLAHVWQAYKAELATLQQQEDALDAERASIWPRSGVFGVSTESAAQRNRRLAIRQSRETLNEQVRWLNEVDAEAKSVLNRLRVYGTAAAGTRQRLEVWNALLTEWFQPQSMTPELAELFSFFVHDRQVLSSAQRTARTFFGEKFFSIRGFDRPTGSLPVEASASSSNQPPGSLGTQATSMG